MEHLTRRRFLCKSAAAVCAVQGSLGMALGTGSSFASPTDVRGKILKGDAPEKPWRWSREGFRYTRHANRRTVCGVCPNRCVLDPGDRSVCRSKVNIDGILYSLAYGNPCAVNLDPVEKKPLYHFLPQTTAFSIATTGCSFRCLNCQNWEISQTRPHDVRHRELFPADAVREAARAGAASIAYTYSEATTFIEYMMDIAVNARNRGIRNLYISNGYINREPLLELCGVLDAANIDLKSFDDATYRRLNGGRLKPVLNTLKTLVDQGVHLEIAVLLIPGHTDDPETVRRMCHWMLENIGPDHPLHFLRFFPRYKMNRLPPTPVSTVVDMRQLALDEGIHYVYCGNIPGHDGNNTYCHRCKKLLIERQGYFIAANNIDAGKCIFCNTVIPGVWGETVRL